MSVFLRLIFSQNTFADFEKWVIIFRATCWLRARKLILSANMSSRTRIFLAFLAELYLMPLNKLVPGLVCIYTPWMKILKISDKTTEKKKTRTVWGKDTAFFHTMPNLKLFQESFSQSVECLFLVLVGWLFGFYGISIFVGYLTPNSFLCT